MNDKNAMISQQAKSIAASAVMGNGKNQNSKNEKLSGITKLREVHKTSDDSRHYSFAFFIGVLISVIAALFFGFMLGVTGIF